MTTSQDPPDYIHRAFGDDRTLDTTFEIFNTYGPVTADCAQLFSRLRPDTHDSIGSHAR